MDEKIPYITNKRALKSYQEAIKVGQPSRFILIHNTSESMMFTI